MTTDWILLQFDPDRLKAQRAYRLYVRPDIEVPSPFEDLVGGFLLGGGKFIHASSVRGQVTIDSLSTAYYARHFAGARRP